MALSAELQRIYSGEVDISYWSGLVLSHSLAGTLYLTDYHEATVGLVDGFARTFAPVPFSARLPERDAPSGRQDLQLAICAIGDEARTLLDAAIEDPTEPISCRYGQWPIGDTEPMWDPLLELWLTDIALNVDTLSATASRADVLNRAIPTALYRPAQYPGLVRR